MTRAKPLSDKQKRFAKEYMLDMNATQAAIRCGYSANNATTQGSLLLAHPGVQRLIEASRQRLMEKVDLTAERIIEEVRRIGFSDIRKLYNAEGDLKKPHELDDETAAALEALEVEAPLGRPGVLVKKAKLSAKLPALIRLGQQLGIFKDKVEHSGKIEVEDLTVLTDEELAARAEAVAKKAREKKK